MREEFNKPDYIIVTGSGDREFCLPRNRIESVRESGDENLSTAIRLYEDDGSVIPHNLLVKGTAEEIVGRINGEPDPAQVFQWREKIIRERQAEAAAKLEVEGVRRGEAIEAARQSHQHTLGRVADALAVETARLTHARDKIAASPRLRIANRLFSVSAIENVPQRLARGVDWLGRRIAGGDVRHFLTAETASMNGNVLKDRQRQFEAAFDTDIRHRERQFEQEKRYLESQLRDPDMRGEDHARLRKIINDYRRDHAPPDFRFVRDPATGRYRSDKLLRRERSAALARSLSKSRERSRESVFPLDEQGREDVQRRARGPKRSRSRSRSPSMERD